ncbi:LPXTG cell wall anchor domain-containing protein [Streptomyces inusitatus]|nr:LPXTG cell wall anchor domain-containing protein [Streptomyces inusitatus]
MKLRRALTVAATAAVLAPATFLAAPTAAFATGPSSPTPSASTTGSTPAPDRSAPAPDATSSAPATPESDPADAVAPSGTAAGPDAPTAPGSSDAVGRTPGKAPVAPSPDTSMSANPPKEEEGEVCDTVVESSKAIDTELRGLPTKVVAGSGWIDLSYRLTNRSEQTRTGISAYAEIYTTDAQYESSSRYVTLQWQVDGKWQTIDMEFGYFGTAGTLKPGEYSEVKMRLKVDAKAEPGAGTAFSGGWYTETTESGLSCESGGHKRYNFEVLAPGSKPGEVDESEGEKPGENGGTGGTGGTGESDGEGGKGGTGDELVDRPVAKPAPQGGLAELPVTGRLAETGSNSALPTVGVVGGIAVLAGAGVLFALKRRRDNTTA